MILKGIHKGEHGTMIGRGTSSTTSNIVTIQLIEELEVFEIDMDSIAEID